METTVSLEILQLSFVVYVLVFAVFIGFEVISKVPTMLHTPLMSGSNAISGIVIVGAIAVTAIQESTYSKWLAYFAVFLATINVVGGFVVTDRMLGMFRNKRKAK